MAIPRSLQKQRDAGKDSAKDEAIARQKQASETAAKGAFMARITGDMNALWQKYSQGFKDPKDRRMAEAFLWDAIYTRAKKESDAIWDKLMEDGVIMSTDGLGPGDYELGSATQFVAVVEITQPVMRFNPKTLAAALKRDYKIPIPRTIELVDRSKIATAGQTRLNMKEKGV